MAVLVVIGVGVGVLAATIHETADGLLGKVHGGLLGARLCDDSGGAGDKCLQR
ncbi:MAG: hypothetical protein ACLQCU_09995 [Acidimicrobiales bacterium]